MRTQSFRAMSDPETPETLRLLSAYSPEDQKLIREHLWVHPESYAGADWYDTIGVVGQSRDSEILEISNFESALELLGGESETVLKAGASHWACGWVESLRVHISDVEKTLKALEIIRQLNDYPVLDEDDYNERENEYISDYANGAKDDLAKSLAIHLGLPEEMQTDPDLIEVAYRLNVECQHYYGHDSCINVYEFREPDASDWDRVLNCLGQMYFADGENAAFDFLSAAFDENGGTK